MASTTLKLVDALTGDGMDRFEAAGKLDAMLARGADLTEAVPPLTARLWAIDHKLQPTVLGILATAMDRAAFADLVRDVAAAVDSKDRGRRRQAADILLAWVDYKGRDRDRAKLAPQAAYVALAQAFRHKDSVLRKRVCDEFYPCAWQAPEFREIERILLMAYDATDGDASKRVDQALQFAAECGLDVSDAIPSLEGRLPSRAGKAALSALIAYHVHRDDVSRAMALFLEHDGGAYVCQQVGGSVRPIRGTAGLGILLAGLGHSEPDARFRAAAGLQKFAEEGADISAAAGLLGSLLSDTAPIRLARTTVGAQAARALAGAGRRSSARREVSRVLKEAERSGDRAAAENAASARSMMAGKPG